MKKALFFIILTVMVLGFQPVSADVQAIAKGGYVFVGEQGINIAAGAESAPQLAWFSAGKNPSADIPDSVLPVGNAASFYVAPANFAGRYGNWYQWTGSSPAGAAAFHVLDPSLDIRVWDQNTNSDVTGKQVQPSDYLNFRIETNMFVIAARDPSAAGIFTIKVKTAEGFVYSTLYQVSPTATNPNGVMINLTAVRITQQPGYWVTPISPGSGWFTGATDLQGGSMYTGTYTCTVETNINGMKDNYRAPDGSENTGKTVSAERLVTIAGPAPTAEPTTGIPASDVINLYPGWNFVSTPRILADDNNTARHVFGNVNAAGHSIYLYNAQNGVWEPLAASSIIKPLDGIWMYSNNPVQVDLHYKNNPLETPPTKHLYPGWNAIGSGEYQQVSAHNALLTIQGSWAKLIGFDNILQSYDSTIFNSNPSNQATVYPKKGYWVFMTTNGVYS